jgi:TRAP-type C4-dicarboxylate transport system permease small subunit
MSRTLLARPWFAWLVAFLALATFGYSVLGYVMVADLYGGRPTTNGTITAYVYLALIALSALTLLAAVLVLLRRSRRQRSTQVPMAPRS